MTKLNESIINTCKTKLISMKADLLNRLRINKTFLIESNNKIGGDEIDQTVAQLEENSLLITQDRIRHQLFEIETALAKIERGTFGICEETDEEIDPERLLAIPWTRLSLEGAEHRETLTRRNVASKK